MLYGYQFLEQLGPAKRRSDRRSVEVQIKQGEGTRGRTPKAVCTRGSMNGRICSLSLLGNVGESAEIPVRIKVGKVLKY